MSKSSASLQLRVLAVTAAFALALMATLAMWGTSHAADATATPAATGCAQASTTKGADAGTPVAKATCVDQGLFDIYYGANLITIPADTDVTFVVTNHGAGMHTFTITDHNNKDVKNLKIDESFNPGDTKDVTINAPAGDYYFYCTVPGHEQAGMWGILKVTDKGAITAQSVDNPKDAK